MDRSQTISELLKVHRLSAAAAVNYFERPRKYTEDDALYMREVHFVIELGAMGTPTMSEMAQRLNVTQGAVTQMAARMEKKGYVTRSKDSMDKRVTILSLTEQGKVLRKNHMEFDKARYEA
ncbi:MAG TPA: MarR family transcriptional regulator, partial [Candidatus Ventrimonas merdavium]|nr:MarR family transcriptional regulator [Candidatus Ventrimonas merdavium]